MQLGSASGIVGPAPTTSVQPQPHIIRLMGLTETYRSGDGGSGEIVEAGRGKYVKNNKYHPGANQPKQIWLPASE